MSDRQMTLQEPSALDGASSPVAAARELARGARELPEALRELGEYPDVVIGCAGGGSNLGGLIAPFMRDKLRGERPDTRFVAVEPASCPSLTRGRYAYDFADTGQTCPLCKMYTLGNGFIPSPDHAGGLRYHGMSPIVSKLKHDGYLEAVAVRQTEVFEAGEKFAKLETILPAPESAHAILAAMREAEKCRETGEAKTILFGLTGTGYFDMVAYDKFNRGEMEDHVPTDEELEAGFATIPHVPGIQEGHVSGRGVTAKRRDVSARLRPRAPADALALGTQP